MFAPPNQNSSFTTGRRRADFIAPNFVTPFDCSVLKPSGNPEASSCLRRRGPPRWRPRAEDYRRHRRLRTGAAKEPRSCFRPRAWQPAEAEGRGIRDQGKVLRITIISSTIIVSRRKYAVNLAPESSPVLKFKDSV